MDAMMDAALHWVDRLATGIEFVALAVLALGVARAAVGFLRDGAGARAAGYAGLRVALGGHILLALEILICADIMHTVIRREIEDLIVLSAVVVIRTVIAFFLNLELREQRRAPDEGPAS